MLAVLFTLIGYLAGSIPFSVWLGRLVLGVDIRQFGDDQNPGSANAFKAAGKSKWWLGMSVLLADGLKGLIPVAIGYYNFGIQDWTLVPVALAPVVGHAYSIFLRFRGGKALATTFGIWTALTVWRGPAALGVFFILFYLILDSSAWSVMLGMLGLLGYLLVTPEPYITSQLNLFLVIWAGNMLILILKHYPELRRLPRLKSRPKSRPKSRQK